ncbi:MAG: DUF1338 family protein [Chlamydiales bacterium]|nr:DUF1338 domain-containing protein [Chlamydiales bacterium]NCF70649.1 DUF1338 family protein [Chlamydiales bacterium]
MMTKQSAPLDRLLSRLMQQYKKQVPDVERILKLLETEQLLSSIKDLENDHIAFRTLGLDKLGIQSLEKIFLHYGYVKEDPYSFEQKKLNAYWYSPPEESFPRIFISELRVAELSLKAQEIIKDYTSSITVDPVDALDLADPEACADFLQSPLWPAPTIEDYNFLEQESEYAAWVIYNRFYLNHFTISVHNLNKHNTLDSFVSFLESHGLLINDAGGKVKRSPDGLLIQGSTVAAKEKVLFKTKAATTEEKEIATAYVEFAERKVLPEFAHLKPEDVKRCHRREGFEAQNANSIFESTYTTQTNKRS